MLEHNQQCLLKAQLETDDASNERCQEIQKEELQLSLKPKIMESLERVKSIFLNEIKPFSKYQDVTEPNETPKVIDDDETKDEIEVIEYHFEASKISADQKTPEQMITILGNIKSMEFWTKMPVMIPIFHKIYQLIKSKYTYEKVFAYEFQRAHHSVFTVNYKDVYGEAHSEAIDAIWETAYKKALDSVFESPIYDSVYKESYDLALKSCNPEKDEEKFEELFDSIYEPLLDKEVDLAIDSEIESSRNGKEFQETFQKSVFSTFEDTLLSTIESTYRKMIDSMYCDELEKTHQAYLDIL